MKKLYVVLLVLFLASCGKDGQPREVWIENAQKETIYLQIEGNENAGNKKLAVIQHGLASNMEHPAVQTVKKAFRDKGYTVITFDSRYSLGKSDGDVINVRLSAFEDDLKTVIGWAKNQGIYSEPFALAGHSLGGASVLQYAAENPSAVDYAVPVTPVVSGKRWEESCMANMLDFCRNWKRNGHYDYRAAVIPYEVVEQAKNYDALRLAKDIRAKVLLVTAEDDNVIEPKDVKALYDALQTKKSLGVISDGGHNFTTEQSRRQLYDLVTDFLSK